MTAKFISTVFRTASVVAIPLAILTVSVPASAQRSSERGNSERGNSEWHGKGHQKNPNYKNGHFKNKHYKNGRYTNRRERDDNGLDRQCRPVLQSQSSRFERKESRFKP